nr:FAD synthetase [Virgibacillus ihumii]
MEIYKAEKLNLSESIIAIGAFDGVHRGHQAVIQEAVRESKKRRIPSVVYTFDPPPRTYFQGAYILTSIEEKIQKFKKLGVDYVIVAQFNESYIKRTPNSFINELKHLSPKNIRVGEDFRFGKNRKGDVALLKNHFFVQTVSEVCCNQGLRISSTRIRNMVFEGDLKKTESLMGLDSSL